MDISTEKEDNAIEECQHGRIRGDQAESDSEHEAAIFSAVLSSLNLEHLPAFCVSSRKESAVFSANADVPIEPITVDSPIFGSYHALFPIQFQDGLRWILKVPECGTPKHFNSSASSALRSEALSMRLIRRETSVPVPQVLAFNAALENEIGCPFILMSFIQGMSLYDCWFNKKIPKEELKERRTRTLMDIAYAMAELGQFSFSVGGALTFDQDGNLNAPGPIRFADNQAMIERLDKDDEDETALYFEAGPFTDANSFYLLTLDRAKGHEDTLEEGMKKLLRMLFSWVPEQHDPKFVLTHPDLDIQNILVSEDGSLQGLIDWDGVAPVPRLVGNEKFPSWLTRDWDPAMYAWNEDMEKGIEPDTLWEDSPDTLALHRTEYNDFLQRHLRLRNGSVRSSSTRMSLFVENLLIATENPLCRFDILEKFISKIVELAPKYWNRLDTGENESGDSEDDKVGDLDFFDITNALANGEAKKEMVDFLRTGFEVLLNSSQ